MRRVRLLEEANTIMYLSGNGNYTNVHFADSPVVLLSKTIRVCTAELPGFIRIHKKYAINPKYIVESKVVDAKTAEILTGSVWLPVSRRRLREVMEQLQPELYTKGTWYYLQAMS